MLSSIWEVGRTEGRLPTYVNDVVTISIFFFTVKDLLGAEGKLLGGVSCRRVYGEIRCVHIIPTSHMALNILIIGCSTF